MSETNFELTIPVKREIGWCLGIDCLALNEDTKTLQTYFYPNVEDLSYEELKEFVLALSEFVKDYNRKEY